MLRMTCFRAKFRFIADLVARTASPETVASSPRASTVSCTSAVAGRTKLPWGRRERQPDGSAAGGHENFFPELPVFRSAPHPTIPASPDARSREPSPRTAAAGTGAAETGRPSRAPRLHEIAHQLFVEAGSGALPAGVARRLMIGMSMRGCLKKILMAPCRTSYLVPTLGFACSGCPAGLQLNSVGAPFTRLACNQIHEEPYLRYSPERSARSAATRCTCWTSPPPASTPPTWRSCTG
jgi:hypothetical protein